ncbi:type II RES/Xre toxin-antitoxin system antitoxin [Niveispirillum irakense]|uniref:type II RES/Xre toxin-antitoxin system antitoxin n=1 Tax=Niveispirillum irakense TaxID=34011 RepID=UPI0004039AC4|nr:antitoxin Xre/MbcA/ParS toxin-binding domain-containing protein [Niveispirillum irakense]
MQPDRLTDMMGGTAALGAELHDVNDLVRLVRAGLPLATVEAIVDGGWLNRAELSTIVLNGTSLSARRVQGRLTASQSDRLVRALRVLSLTVETFGNRDKAAHWLRRPSTILGGETPLSLLDTDEGTRAVETLLGRIGHGIAA